MRRASLAAWPRYCHCVYLPVLQSPVLHSSVLHNPLGLRHRGARLYQVAVLAAILTTGCATPLDQVDAATTPDRQSYAEQVDQLANTAPSPDGESEPQSTSTPVPAPTQAMESPTGVAATPQPVPTIADLSYEPGIAQLLADPRLLAGDRVGLIVNQASVHDARHTVDVLDALAEVELVALFAPEHGVRGRVGAGALVTDEIDAASGLFVHSLYGASRAPTAGALADIDVLVYDLQDVGARFYTYISTLGLAMQAAAESGVRFVVLDRPNPHGRRLSGHVLEPDFTSFVGQYPIPMLYGLTSGELAQAIKGERWLDGLETLDLEVVPMQQWAGTDGWPLDRNAWIGPSPGLPHLGGTLTYPGAVLFEATTLSYGRGTDLAFSVVGAPWLDAASLVSQLRELDLDGVEFAVTNFTPRSTPTATDPAFVDLALEGVHWRSIDHETFDPVVAAVAMLGLIADQADRAGQPLIDRPEFFDLLAGTADLRLDIEQRKPVNEIVASWSAETAAFGTRMLPYRLYEG